MYIIVQYYTFCLINLFLGLSSHCAYDLLERRLHNLNEKDYSEVQTLVQVGNRLVYISFFDTCLIIIPQRSEFVLIIL